MKKLKIKEILKMHIENIITVKKGNTIIVGENKHNIQEDGFAIFYHGQEEQPIIVSADEFEKINLSSLVHIERPKFTSDINLTQKIITSYNYLDSLIFRSKRIKITAYISPDQSESQNITEIERNLSYWLSSFYGGCTTDIKSGYWSEEGNENLPIYRDINQVKTIAINLTLLPQDSQLGIETIKRTIKKLKKVNDWSTPNWIHIEKATIYSNHQKV